MRCWTAGNDLVRVGTARLRPSDRHELGTQRAFGHVLIVGAAQEPDPGHGRLTPERDGIDVIELDLLS